MFVSQFVRPRDEKDSRWPHTAGEWSARGRFEFAFEISQGPSTATIRINEYTKDQVDAQDIDSQCCMEKVGASALDTLGPREPCR